MSNVLLYERASGSFAAGLAKRGHHIVYRTNEANHCPGCGHSQWYVGRVSAECVFCGTAVALAETSRREAIPASSRLASVPTSSDLLRHHRIAVKDRQLKLLIDNSPRVLLFATSRRAV